MIGLLLAAALTLSVTPRIAFAPATVRARVRVDVGADARALVVTLDSGEFAQQSALPIDARRGPRQTHELAPWTRVPAGDYTITVTLVDAAGRPLDRQTTTIHLVSGVPQ